jgi:Mg-chelatase subunit ChlD
VGVLAFDLRPHWVVRFSEAGPEWNGAEAVMGLTADGGTDIGNALEEALVGFQTDARVRAAERKHLILISDGDTVPRDWESVLMHLSAEGVTLSTICLGSPRSDEHLMYQLTEAANGRFRSMTNSGDLARALMSETRRICAGP